jgi:hypothetical protein
MASGVYSTTYGGSDCGYANQNQQGLQSAKPMSLVESHVLRLSESAGAIEGLASRLHKLADELFGPAGQVAGKEGQAPGPCSSLAKLTEVQVRQDRAITSLRAAVERLEGR